MVEGEFLQQTEQAPPLPEPLLGYIDQKITQLDKRMSNMGNKDGKARSLIDAEQYQQERARLQSIRDAMLRGEYRGIATLLQTERTQAEQELTSLQQQIRPLSPNPQEESMQGDDMFRYYQERILREQGILMKAAAVLDGEDRAYLTANIDHYRNEQLYTQRGGVLGKMKSMQQRIDRSASLQRLIPQPSMRSGGAASAPGPHS